MNRFPGHPNYARPPQDNRRLGYFLTAIFGAVVGALLIVMLIPQMVPVMQDMGVMPVVEAPDEGLQAPPASPGPTKPPVVTDYEQNIIRVVEKTTPTIVTVTNVRRVQDAFGRVYERDGQGSGVIIDSDGYIVTNYHVIEDAEEILVETYDNEEYTATIVGEDPSTDLAVLRIDATGLTAAEFGDSDTIVAGQLAIAIGNPLGREFARSVTVGVVSGVRPAMYGQAARQRVFQLVQTDASINPGNSGGALLDSEGRVIGINTVKMAGETVEGMGFAIPSNTVSRITSQLIEDGAVYRSWMGISVSPVPVEENGGAKLERVLDGSPADEAGIRVGDIIVRIDDAEVREVVDLLAYLEETAPGETVEVEILRDGVSEVVDVTLDVMPE